VLERKFHADSYRQTNQNALAQIKKEKGGRTLGEASRGKLPYASLHTRFLTESVNVAEDGKEKSQAGPGFFNHEDGDRSRNRKKRIPRE